MSRFKQSELPAAHLFHLRGRSSFIDDLLEGAGDLVSWLQVGL